MRFYPEPVAGTDSDYSTAVVLVNLGTPDAPTASALRSYLRQFLSDPRVVEIPRWLWWLLLRLVILPFRPAKSAAKYAVIWSNEGSPLKFHSIKQAALLRGYLGQRGHQVNVVYAMRYANPSVPDVLAQLQADGYQRILILPAYPQYSSATTGSTFDAVFTHYARVRNVPELRFVRHYPQQSGYIEALRQVIWNHWQQHGQAGVLVLSFHGMPQRTRELGDPYYDECLSTARALVARLGLSEDQFRVTFQSRFGRAAWLQPYTSGTVQALAKQGVRRVDVICPGFVADCL
ncbi:MAG: ferrochelatase, partial [Herbaspirillum sp.]